MPDDLYTLSGRHAAVHAAYFGLLRRDRRPPTVREIAQACGLGLATTHAHLIRFVAEGKLAHHEGSTRGFVPAGQLDGRRLHALVREEFDTAPSWDMMSDATRARWERIAARVRSAAPDL